MSTLKEIAHRMISELVESQDETHTAIDVLRVIKDHSTLLYEQQALLDNLDLDPMHQLKEAQPQIRRIKVRLGRDLLLSTYSGNEPFACSNSCFDSPIPPCIVQKLLSVIRCDRLVTRDGYSSIDAAVQLDRDSDMDEMVESHLQLSFRYERRPMTAGDLEFEGDPPFPSPEGRTHVGYFIDLSRDHGEKIRLLAVVIWAKGKNPSVLPPEPLQTNDDDEWEDIDEDDKMETSQGSIQGSQEDEDASFNDTNAASEAKCDQYVAILDPDPLSDLMTWTNLGLGEVTVFFLLMTFPFFEHEWDLVGLILEAAFGVEEEDDDNMEVLDQRLENQSNATDVKRNQDLYVICLCEGPSWKPAMNDDLSHLSLYGFKVLLKPWLLA